MEIVLGLIKELAAVVALVRSSAVLSQLSKWVIIAADLDRVAISQRPRTESRKDLHLFFFFDLWI